MSLFIENLWIFTQEGTPIVEVLNNEKMDSALLEAFMQVHPFPSSLEKHSMIYVSPLEKNSKE
jgi:hypothetical protein